MRQSQLRTLWVGLVYDSVMLLSLIGLGYFKFVPISWLGAVLLLGAHVCLVEPLYYLLHRLYHTPLGIRYLHQDHHASVVTQPETAVSFFLLERLIYTVIFIPPLLLVSAMGYLSLGIAVGYILVIDSINIWGHFNVGTIPKWWHKSIFKYLLYSPQYHSVHHRNSKRNFSLFMPLWDVVFGTAHWESS